MIAECRGNSYVHSSVTAVGSVCIFYLLLRLLTFLRKLFLRESHDAAERYGACTWALVTGPTSPSGRGLAIELARRGFNLVLVGRDIEALQRLRDVLVLKHGHGVKVRIVVADFRESAELSFYTEILRQVDDLDVSILVHAVGKANLSRKFHQQSVEQCRQCLIVNMFAPVLLSQQMIPRMQQRYHRSAIIVVGGENAHQPIPGMAVSSGAKAFLRHFGISASVEYEDKIDVLAVQPFAVSAETKQNESVFVIDSERFARATLNQLGHERSSSGDWIHQLLSWCYRRLPHEVALHFWSKVLTPHASKLQGDDEQVSLTNYFAELSQLSKRKSK